MRLPISLALPLMLALGLPPAGHAQDRLVEEPADLVRAIYAAIGVPASADPFSFEFMTRPENRSQYFTDDRVSFLDDNDTHGSDLLEACLDFSLYLNGNDFDEAEIAGSLQMSEQVWGDGARIQVQFTNFGEVNHFAFEFVRADGQWRIDDIASLHGAIWRWSEIPCSPSGGGDATDTALIRTVQSQLAALGYDPGPADGAWGQRTGAALERFARDRGLAYEGGLSTTLAMAVEQAGTQAPPRPEANLRVPGQYCFAKDDGSVAANMEVTVLGDGNARMELTSRHTNDHMCSFSADNIFSPSPAGWTFREAVLDLQCQLAIVLTETGGLRLTDQDDQCKRFYCGMSAAFEEVSFSGSDRRDCG